MEQNGKHSFRVTESLLTYTDVTEGMMLTLEASFLSTAPLKLEMSNDREKVVRIAQTQRCL